MPTSEILFTLLLAVGFIALIAYTRHWRSKNNVSRCPKCGTMTHAKGSVSMMRGGSYVHDYRCPNCGYEWHD